MVLYAKSLNASATVLGIIAGMMPLLAVFQIPAAKYLGRFGYKRFVFAGWGTRTTFIVGMALVPLTYSFWDESTRLVMVLILLFCFNLVRGITSCAWLPWTTALVPQSLRGTYLLKDMAFQNIGGFVVFLVSAFCLGTHPGTTHFVALFAFSAVMGGISLNFLRQVPEGQAPAGVKGSSTPVPWREMLFFSPFRKLLVTSLAWAVAYGGISTFIVAFLKSETALTERDIMLLMSATFIGGLGSLGFLGSRLDQLGSKPVLTFAASSWLLLGTGWVLISGKVIGLNIVVVLILLFGVGLAYSLANMAQNRLAMAVVPKMGRDHFFALFSVITNVTLGLSPVFWGVFIDVLAKIHGKWCGLELNRFSLFFAVVTLCFLLTAIFATRLEERNAATMDELFKDIVQHSPLRFLQSWRE